MSAGGGRVGVVLAGGGARGAYEAGALSVVGRVLAERGEWPNVFSGVSVGAINAVSLAGMATLDSDERAERALARWREVVQPNVFGSVVAQLPRLLARLLADAALPGPGRVHALLDTMPLNRHLRRWIDWDELHDVLAAGAVHAVGVAATGAYSGRTTVFWEGSRDGDEPAGDTPRYVRTRLVPEHVLAAAAMPVLFPAVAVPGAAGWYVDGGTRLRDPLRPALDLGADRLLIVATESLEETEEEDGPQPTIADAAANAVHAILDAIRTSVKQLAVGGERPYAVIAPPRPGEIGRLAGRILHDRHRLMGRLPRSELGILDRLIGGDSPLHGELLSLLLFDREFIDELIVMGARDARAWLDAHPGVWVSGAAARPR